MMRFRKVERRILKPYRRKVREIRKLEKRCLGSHLRWRALAEEPGRTVLVALLLLAARLGESDE